MHGVQEKPKGSGAFSTVYAASYNGAVAVAKVRAGPVIFPMPRRNRSRHACHNARGSHTAALGAGRHVCLLAARSQLHCRTCGEAG